MPLELIYILLFVLIGGGFALFTYFLQRALAPFRPSRKKAEPYECGEIIVGQPWVRIHVRYYIFALLFLIFDIETVFLFPWAVAFKQLGLVGFVEMFVFIALLLLALFYPWKKGVLEWV